MIENLGSVSPWCICFRDAVYFKLTTPRGGGLVKEQSEIQWAVIDDDDYVTMMEMLLMFEVRDQVRRVHGFNSTKWRTEGYLNAC